MQDNLNGADITNISKEKEDGVEQYEIESRLNGKSRDFNVDDKGKLLLVEVQDRRSMLFLPQQRLRYLKWSPTAS